MFTCVYPVHYYVVSRCKGKKKVMNYIQENFGCSEGKQTNIQRNTQTLLRGGLSSKSSSLAELMGTVNHLHRLGPMEVAKLTLLHVVMSEVQRLICTGSLRMRSTACAQLHTEEGST